MVRWILSQCELANELLRRERIWVWSGVVSWLTKGKGGDRKELMFLKPPLGASICVSSVKGKCWNDRKLRLRRILCIRSDTAGCRAGMAVQPCWTFLRLMNIHLTVCLISGILLPTLISFLLSHLTLCTKPFCLCFGSRLGSPPLEIVFWPSKREGHPISLSATAVAATLCHSVVFLMLTSGYLFSFLSPY